MQILTDFWFLFPALALILAIKGFRRQTKYVWGTVLAVVSLSLIGLAVHYLAYPTIWVILMAVGIAFIMYDGYEQNEPKTLFEEFADDSPQVVQCFFVLGGFALVILGAYVRFHAITGS